MSAKNLGFGPYWGISPPLHIQIEGGFPLVEGTAEGVLSPVKSIGQNSPEIITYLYSPLSSLRPSREIDPSSLLAVRAMDRSGLCAVHSIHRGV